MTRFKQLQIALAIQCVLLILVIYALIIVAQQEVNLLTIEKSRILAQDLGSMLEQADAMVAEANGPNKSNMDLLTVKHRELYSSTSSYANTTAKIASVDQLLSFLSILSTPQMDSMYSLDEVHRLTLSSYKSLNQAIDHPSEIMNINEYEYVVAQVYIKGAKSQLQKLNEQLALFDVKP